MPMLWISFVLVLSACNMPASMNLTVVTPSPAPAGLAEPTITPEPFVDLSGNTATPTAYNDANGGSTSAPLANTSLPAAVSLGSSPATVTSAGNSPAATVASGGNSPAATVSVTYTGASPAPTIDKFVLPTTAQAGDTVAMEWRTSNANCGVSIGGILAPDGGVEDYGIPLDAGDTTLEIVIIASGGDCANPQIATDVRYIKVSKASTSTQYKASIELAPFDGIDLDGQGGNQDIYFYSDGLVNELRAYGSAEISYYGGSLPTYCGGGYLSQAIFAGNYYCFSTIEHNSGYLYVDKLRFNENSGEYILKINITTDVQH